MFGSMLLFDGVAGSASIVALPLTVWGIVQATRAKAEASNARAAATEARDAVRRTVTRQSLLHEVLTLRVAAELLGAAVRSDDSEATRLASLAWRDACARCLTLLGPLRPIVVRAHTDDEAWDVDDHFDKALRLSVAMVEAAQQGLRGHDPNEPVGPSVDELSTSVVRVTTLASSVGEYLRLNDGQENP